jgi:hypothetical protein
MKRSELRAIVQECINEAANEPDYKQLAKILEQSMRVVDACIKNARNVDGDLENLAHLYEESGHVNQALLAGQIADANWKVLADLNRLHLLVKQDLHAAMKYRR